MKLFTKEINNKLFAQYPKGNDLDSQLAVAKIFNPYGKGRWFLINSDPEDSDYLWVIVQMGDVVEVGSVLRSELESIRVSPFRFPLERDLGFRMVNAGELLRGLQQGKFYNNGGTIKAAYGMEVGRYYKDKNGNNFRYIGENSGNETLFNDGERVVVKSVDDFDNEPKSKKLFGIFEEGGELNLKDDFLNDMAKMHKEIAEITLVDGSKISGEQIRKEHHKYEDGGFVDKTDEELKGMSDDELFEYLDAKAAYMKQYARPLSSFKAKNFAANAAAVQFQNEGTSKLDANFPNLAKINQQATKDYEETISKRKDKMADGGIFATMEQVMTFEEFKKKLPILHDIKAGDNGVEYKPKYNKYSDTLMYFKHGRTNSEKVSLGEAYKHYKYFLEKGEEYASGGFTSSFSGAPSEKFVSTMHKMAKGGEIKVGDYIRIKDGMKGKLMNIEGENLEVKKITKQRFPSGMRKFYHVEYDGYTYDVRADLVDYDKMAMGGKVKFQDKVKAIKASLLKTKKVPKKVQKDYGKTYDAKEAEQAAKRIAGAMRKKEMK